MKRIVGQIPRTTVSLNGQVTWKYFQNPKTGCWIGICDPFRLTLQADSYPELLESMSESVECMFRDLAKSGEIQAFLNEHGWAAAKPLPKNQHNLSFDYPLQTRRIDASDYAEAVS